MDNYNYPHQVATDFFVLNPMGITVATFLDFLAVFHDGDHILHFRTPSTLGFCAQDASCSPVSILPLFLVIGSLVLSSRIKMTVFRLFCH